MSTRKGYLGGYLDPALKDRFVQQAEEQGVNQTDLLSEVISAYLEEDDPDLEGASFVEVEEEEFEEDDALWESFDSEVYEELNAIILQAGEEVDKDDPLYLSKTLEILADALFKAVKQPVTPDPDDPDFEEAFDELLCQEIITQIDMVIVKTGAEEEDRNALFLALGKALDERAQALHQHLRLTVLRFSREEWYYIDKLLEEVNESRSESFPDLAAFLRFKLGEMLEYTGTGFIIPRNREMRTIGRQMMG